MKAIAIFPTRREVTLVDHPEPAITSPFQMLEVVGTNGVFVFTGVPGRKAPIELDGDLIMRNPVLANRVEFGTVNASRADYEVAIRDLGAFTKRWPTAVRRLTTGRQPIDNAVHVLLGAPSGIKDVVTLA